MLARAVAVAVHHTTISLDYHCGRGRQWCNVYRGHTALLSIELRALRGPSVVVVVEGAVEAHMGGHGRGRGRVGVVVVSGNLYCCCCCCCYFPNNDRGRGHGHGRSSRRGTHHHVCRRKWAAAAGTNDSVRHNACSCLL